jgi:hypothetical protein
VERQGSATGAPEERRGTQIIICQPGQRSASGAPGTQIICQASSRTRSGAPASGASKHNLQTEGDSNNNLPAGSERAQRSASERPSNSLPRPSEVTQCARGTLSRQGGSQRSAVVNSNNNSPAGPKGAGERQRSFEASASGASTHNLPCPRVGRSGASGARAPASFDQ